MKYSTDRRTHSILEDILRAVVVPAFVADRNFHIISANSRFMSTCLLGSGNRTGSMGRIDSFLPSPGVLEKLDSVFSSGLAMEPVETACETEDGAKKSIRVAAGLLNGIDPGARYLLVTLEDTSARRKVEEQLSQEQKLGAIGKPGGGDSTRDQHADSVYRRQYTIPFRCIRRSPGAFQIVRRADRRRRGNPHRLADTDQQDSGEC